MSHKRKNQHFRHWLIITMVLLSAVVTVQYSAINLRISLLNTPQHAPFDGTVYPVQEVPNWTYTDYAMQSNSYSYFSSAGMLIPIPEYDADVLIEDTADLTWGTQAYEDVANTQITYPVPYAGNYKGDGKEYAGSHPAIDIKAPKGTPVYAIANGVVIETIYSSSGFGNYIVIAHHDVPSLANENYKTDLYSSYSHLNSVIVSEGDVVEKGEMIGKVGDSGLATTNHLHFQIDNDEAPWHPYWPFSYSDYSSLGYSFFDAINKAVGYENLLAYTIHPLDYVQKYLDGIDSLQSTVDNDDTVTYTYTSDTVTEEVVAVVESEVAEDIEEEIVTPEPEPIVSRDFHEISLTNDSYVLASSNLTIYMYLNDVSGNRIAGPEFDGSIQIALSDPSVGDLSISHLEKDDFENGHYTLIFSPGKEGTTTLSFELEDYKLETDISVISQLNFVSGFEIEHDGKFVIGIPETVTIKAVDASGNFTPSYNLSGNVALTTIIGDGDFAFDSLSKSNFKSGVAEVIFTPTSTENVLIKAKNGAIVGTSEIMSNILFSDVDTNHEYYKAIKYLREQEIITGYNDGSFKPDNSVSRVEALKMIFEAFDADLSDGSNLTFPDIDNGQWYANYVATAKVSGVVDGYPDGTFKPGNSVNKVEFLKILLNAADADVSPVVIGNPYKDVSSWDWFSPYANMSKELNLAPVNGSYFEPSHYMTRGEVAETIYRWLAIEYNGADEYSVLLNMD
ncbi:MAG: S-layer homology domain-containing protein [Patescibacteria group bacterium]|nr:S-layer homology domain-containing protein [Patescibacteria group bacterium]